MGDFNHEGKRPMYQAVCAQCGRNCEVPFRPSEGRHIYCNACFEAKKNPGRSSSNFKNMPGRGAGDERMHNEIRRQLDILSSKIDRLIGIMEAAKNIKPQVVEEKSNKISKKVSSAKPKKTAKKSAKKKR